MLKDLIVSKCNLLFSILELFEDEFWNGKFLRLNRFFFNPKLLFFIINSKLNLNLDLT